MDIFTLVITMIGTIATVISAIIAINAKNKAENILEEIINEKNRNAINRGSINLDNNGSNIGIIAGINTGDINER